MKRSTDEVIEEIEQIIYHARRCDRLEETIDSLTEQISLLNMVIDTMHSRIAILRDEREKASTPPVRSTFWNAVDEVISLLEPE